MSNKAMDHQSTSYRDALQDDRFAVDRFEREVLLAHVIGQSRAWIWAHLDDPMVREKLETFEKLLTLRADGHPIAYLLGYREFYGRRFQVSPAVLIPRPETELLVELALSLLPETKVRAIDVGTGSGAIGLTLASERPEWSLSLSELSEPALDIARRNRDRLGLGRVKLFHCDLLNGVSEAGFELIISNPPYVARNDPHLRSGDLRFEPEVALACDDAGLALIHKLIRQAPRILVPGGWIVLEHGYDQADSVRSLLRDKGFESVRSWTDLAGIERVSGGRLPS